MTVSMFVIDDPRPDEGQGRQWWVWLEAKVNDLAVLHLFAQRCPLGHGRR